jgi:histidine triad (HIT) family protein
MTSKYDPNNIFAKILKEEIPSDKVYEDEFAIAIRDKFPVAETHVLVIPKADYVNFHDFAEHADAEFITGFYRAVRKTVDELGLNDEKGYRIAMNTGANAGQTIFHYHVHIIAGKGLSTKLPA